MRVRTAALVTAGVLFAGLGGAAVWSVWPAPPVRLTAEEAAQASEPEATATVPELRPAVDPEDLKLLPPLTDDDREAAAKIATELKASAVWDHDAVVRIQATLGQREPAPTFRIFELAGISRYSALRLSLFFGASQRLFDHFLGDRTLLLPSFARAPTNEWELTPVTLNNLVLPFHPRPPWTLDATSLKDGARGQYENCEAIGRHRFMSGTYTEALRCTFRFRDHRFRITTGTDLVHDDWSFADRLDHALAVLPADHLALVKDISVDPGTHPRRYSAQTSSDGKAIHLYLSGAGKTVPQASLDETTAHEIGHVISVQQDAAFWARWDAAIASDGYGISRYGFTNRWEDFAETYVLYLGSGPLRAAYGTKTPARFAEMSALFDRVRRTLD